MSENLLRNGDFEADWSEERSHRCLIVPTDGEIHEAERGNVFAPPGWIPWFKHGLPVEHDPANMIGWAQPEVRDAWITADPMRVQSGQKGVLFFTFFRIHDGGLLQQVEVEPGTQLRLSVWAHAWSNAHGKKHTDDPRWSEGERVGRNHFFTLEGTTEDSGERNFTFWVGIDPTGGRDPFAETVVWGSGAHIYNAYRMVPSAEVTAEAEKVTVFLRSRTLWPYKHNDAYWDDAQLVTVGETPSQDPPASPPVRSKIGLHVLEANAGLTEYIRARPAVVKFVGDWQRARDVPEGVLVVGRRHQGDYDAQRQYLQGQSPRDAARRFVQDQLATYLAHPAIKYWEGHSEPAWPDAEGMAWYAQFEIERIKAMEELGLRCVIGNFATGAPPFNLWPAFLPACEAALQYEAILGLHEYSCPWMWWLTGRYQIDPDDDQGDEGWTTLRYRKVYRRFLIPNGLGVPLAITECGIDPLVTPKPSGAPSATWKGLAEYWEDHHDGPVAYSDDPAEYYFRQLVWYAEQLRQDDYVVGMALFTWGNLEGAWQEFDVSGTPVAERLIRYARDNPAEPFEYSKYASGGGGVPDYVPPRVPYKRVYVLLPQIQDPVERIDWRVAAAIGSSDDMRTVGHSADDAGVGPQDREIVAVNPEKWWGDDLQAWYDENYPDATYETILTDSPWEMAIRLLPELEEDIALAQTDPRWADYDFGQDPGGPASGDAARCYGCLVTTVAIILRKVYQRDVTPVALDKLLVAARTADIDDDLTAWHGILSLFPVFEGHIKDNEVRTARELKELLADGWEVVLRRADGEHLAYLEKVEKDVLHVIDPWDGDRKEMTVSEYEGVRAVRVGSVPSAPAGASGGGAVRRSVPPRVPYSRAYVLLPQIQDPAERIDWRVAAAIGSSDQMRTVGHSADDAGVGPQDREIVAVNADEWGEDIRAWYDEHYPDTKCHRISTDSPWEMAVRLLPLLDEDIALAQTDPRWAGYDFGEQPDDPANGETIGGYGCFLTALGIVLRRVYQRDVTPLVLDRLLASARAAYVNDNLMAWNGVIPMFPAFDDGIKDNNPRSAGQLARLLKDGWEIILRRADGGHFVYLDDVNGDVLHVIDTWDGRQKQRAASHYVGIRAAHIRPLGPPLVPGRVLVGLHDSGGGEWMAEQGLEGCCLVHQVVEREPVQIDCRHIQGAGVTVICRLNWGYADGTGTLPRPVDRGAFVDAVVETVLSARGVDYFHVGNEPNNRQEWPGFGTRDEFALTAEYVTEMYNEIWQSVNGRARIGPPPLDPYFGPGSSNRDWWMHLLENVAGADVLFLHAKTQTNNPAEVWSRERFTDLPLTWQYRHLRTVETSLAVVPERFCSLPVFVTELNPQHLQEAGGAVGWQADNPAWVHEALRYFRQQRPVTGVVFYRYEPAGDQASFGLKNMPAILTAIKEEAARV